MEKSGIGGEGELAEIDPVGQIVQIHPNEIEGAGKFGSYLEHLPPMGGFFGQRIGQGELVRDRDVTVVRHVEEGLAVVGEAPLVVLAKKYLSSG